MKYLVMLCDGMADQPFAPLGDKTPMEIAKKPNIDRLAKTAELGLVKTVAKGLKPGSDVANLAVMGYNPMEFYTGRSPLEAASIGVELCDTDVALRCNLVTLSDEENYEDKTMVDYCAGDISTAEAEVLIKAVEEAFGNEVYSFFPGVAYRHCLRIHNGTTELGTLTPPHDISDRVIKDYLSDGENARPLIEMMKKSYDILSQHPLNIDRVKRGLRPANSIWLWGEGRKPALKKFEEKYGIKAGIVSAVDLLKGIGINAGMKIAEVKGATGYIDTDFEGKAKAALDLFRDGCDLVYLHVEAPDECGHRGEAENKVKAIELIDERVLAPVLSEMDRLYDDYKVMVLPDHPTPLCIKTHTSDPVPYLIWQKSKKAQGAEYFTEKTAAEGIYIEDGYTIMDRFVK